MGIRIDSLSVAYDGQSVIDGLSLSVERGSFFTLLGPSGCGKTTLLRAIAGFVRVSAGRVHFGPLDVTDMPAHQRDIGMVFQDYALFPDKTVFDNVAYGLRARRQDATTITRKVGAALERVGLQALGQRHPAQLSGGQRQRVALARALVIEPQVLLMDEPLSNLDAKLRVQVRQTIAELQAQAGITTVFVTHDQDEALALSHHIGVMKQGRLEQVGTPAQIYREPASSYVADFVGAANVLPLTLGHAVAAGAVVALPLGGQQVQARAIAAVAAGPAVLVARPEDITLGLVVAGQPQGRITRRQYLGEKTHYRVEMADGSGLDVDGHGPGHDAHAVAASVGLVFNTAQTLLLPR
jgi:iron(III) transport system ATP-binding protein